MRKSSTYGKLLLHVMRFHIHMHIFTYIYFCIYACLLLTYYRVPTHLYACRVAFGGDVAGCLADRQVATQAEYGKRHIGESLKFFTRVHFQLIRIFSTILILLGIILILINLY